MPMLPALHDLLYPWAAAQGVPLTGQDAGGIALTFSLIFFRLGQFQMAMFRPQFYPCLP